jgi:hypothetical protein
MSIDDIGLAATPAPPYTAVIFTSLRTEGDNGYDAMVALWKPSPGTSPVTSA